MLNGEINIVDLIILEMVKVLYPDLYTFIGANKELLIENYNDNTRNYDVNYESRDTAKKLFDSFMESHTHIPGKAIIIILQELFPSLEAVFTVRNISHDWKKWHYEKRICIRDYFNKYFRYTVNKDEISDVYFEGILKKLSSHDYSDNITVLFELFKDIDVDELIRKFEIREDFIPQESCYLLAKNLCLAGDSFPNPQEIFSYFNPFRRAAAIISVLIGRVPENNRTELAIDVINNAKPIEFAWEIWFDLHPKINRSFEKQILETVEFQKVSSAILKRTKKEISIEKIIQNFNPAYAKQLINIWSEEDLSELKKNINTYLNEKDDNFFRLIKVFGNVVSSSSEPEPYIANLDPTSMDIMARITDIDMLYDKTIDFFGIQEPPKTDDKMEKISNEELIGIFQAYYKNNQRRSKNEIDI